MYEFQASGSSFCSHFDSGCGAGWWSMDARGALGSSPPSVGGRADAVSLCAGDAGGSVRAAATHTDTRCLSAERSNGSWSPMVCGELRPSSWDDLTRDVDVSILVARVPLIARDASPRVFWNGYVVGAHPRRPVPGREALGCDGRTNESRNTPSCRGQRGYSAPVSPSGKTEFQSMERE